MGGLLKSAGVTDTTRVLDVNLGYTVLSAGGAYIGGLLTPKLRRRPMLMGSSFAAAVSIYLSADTSWGLNLVTSFI
jgi:hypothetical protein